MAHQQSAKAAEPANVTKREAERTTCGQNMSKSMLDTPGLRLNADADEARRGIDGPSELLAAIRIAEAIKG